jgi:hypothetical protein
MRIASRDAVFDKKVVHRRRPDDDAYEVCTSLDSLLDCSIHLRDRYRDARRRSGDIQHAQL